MITHYYLLWSRRSSKSNSDCFFLLFFNYYFFDISFLLMFIKKSRRTRKKRYQKITWFNYSFHFLFILFNHWCTNVCGDCYFVLLVYTFCYRVHSRWDFSWKYSHFVFVLFLLMFICDVILKLKKLSRNMANMSTFI